MRALLDSHTALWAISNVKKVSPRALQVIQDPANELFVSYASLWELSIKIARGKLILPGNSILPFIAELERAGFALLPIRPPHIARTESLPHIHRDPFDRMIVAQALEENLTIISADATLALYPASILWS